MDALSKEDENAMDLSAVKEYTAIFAAIATGLIALVALWGKTHMLQNLQKAWGHTFGKTGDRLEEVMDRLKGIEGELKPNGGASLRDAINRTELRVAESAALQRADFATRPDASFICDAHGDIVWASPAYQRLSGRTMVELSGKGWLNVVRPNKREHAAEQWYGRAVSDDRDYDDLQFWQTPEGTEFGVEVRATRMRSIDGVTLGYFGLVSPVGEGEGSA